MNATPGRVKRPVRVEVFAHTSADARNATSLVDDIMVSCGAQRHEVVDALWGLVEDGVLAYDAMGRVGLTHPRA